MDIRLLFNRYQLGDVALACVFYVITIIMEVSCKPHCRAFQWDDARIANPPHADTFPNYSLAVMIFLTPLVYVVCEFFVVTPLRAWTAKWRRRPSYEANTTNESSAQATLGAAPITSYGGDGASATVVLADGDSDGASTNAWIVAYAWVRTHIFAVALQAIVIDVLKLYCGRLRPDYVSRLAAAGYTAGRSGIPDPMKDPQYYCDLMDKYPALKEGRLSFPSGHSGTSFGVFIVLTLYVFAHLRPFAFQGSFCRLCLSMLPLTVPIFCAASRTRDNKHHFSDVLGGSLIGTAAGLVAFHCCFRSAGGSVAAVRARVQKDIEYLRWSRGAQRQDLAREMQPLAVSRTASGAQGGVTEAELNADAATVAWI